MVKLKECCCGCTLRTGALILLWVSLVINSFGTLKYTSSTFYPSPYRYYYSPRGSRIRDLYFLIWCVFGMATSILGIVGIQKNEPKYLAGYFYYLCYETVYNIFLTLILIPFPLFYVEVSQWTTFVLMINSGSSDNMMVIIMGHMFIFALSGYFTLVVRSCQNAFSKIKDEEIPDPIAVGYSNSA